MSNAAKLASVARGEAAFWACLGPPSASLRLVERPTAEIRRPTQWWAHLVGALRGDPIDIAPTILPKKIEEQLFLARLALVDGGLVSRIGNEEIAHAGESLAPSNFAVASTVVSPRVPGLEYVK